MSAKEPPQRKLPKINLLDRAFALAQENGLTYREACAELGRRGAAARAAKNRRIKIHGLLLPRKNRRNEP